MSQASDLLNGLSGDNIIAPVSVAEKEHIVVGEDRFIRVPDSFIRLGVQHDKDIETVTFDCPRHWGKHDLSSMQIYINYVLPNGEDGRCPVSNLSAIGTKMYFDWTISDYVTQYNGKISFLICAVTVDAEGNEALHWNSELNQECYISEGLECRESTIHKYPDIVTHLLTRMKEVEAIATPEAMQAYTDTWLEANRDRILAEIEALRGPSSEVDLTDYVKSVNGQTPDENGNVEVEIPEGSSGVYVGSDEPTDPDIQIWINPEEAVPDVNYAKSVNGITPDENGNVEIKIPAQSVNAELFNKADLPLDNQSFVTVDGVEYYRYHAGPTNFTWNNPHPQTGSVTITARGVSQYGGTGTARLKTVYNDGTFGPDIYIVVGGESRTASVTTDENKTLAKITGNYDLENWVLLDMSVMSVKADYLVQEKYILPVATADNLGGIKADPVESTDTQPVRIGVDGKLYTTPGGGGDRWTKLGDVTVRGTYEIVPLSFTGGIVTVDTTTEAYSLMSQYNQANCVVHPIDIASKNTAPVVGILRKLDVEAGTFEFLNRDGVLQSTAAYDPTIYKISLDNVTSVEMTDVPSYDLYKLRMTTPVLTSHSLRPFFISTMTCLSMNACAVIVASGGGIFEVETMRYPTDPNYMYKRSNVSYGVWYGCSANSDLVAFELIQAGVGKTQPPANGKIIFTKNHMVFVNGTRFELWGANYDQNR